MALVVDKRPDGRPETSLYGPYNEAMHALMRAKTGDMSDEPIRPLEAFTPFSPEEIGRLERYVAKTRALFECPFIQAEQTTWSVRDGHGGPVTRMMVGAEESEVRDALMLLRPLHLEGEQAGFPKVHTMIKRHAYDKGTDEGRRAIKVVKTYTAGLKTILNNPDLLDLREKRVDDAGNVHTENVTRSASSTTSSTAATSRRTRSASRASGRACPLTRGGSSSSAP